MNRLLQGIAIPYSAVLSILFGLMVLSFPVGAYIVYNSDIDPEINFEYPSDIVPGISLPVRVQLGDIFAVSWAASTVLFAISMMGPVRNFVGSVSRLLSHGVEDIDGSYMVSAIRWFSILVISSLAIVAVQEQFGIVITPPPAQNDLSRFVDVAIAPIIEEVAFRVILIGIPLYLAYSRKMSISHLAASLWNPRQNLRAKSVVWPMLLVTAVAVLFGLSHVLVDESWSSGKASQAVVAGIIIGWVYIRYGLAPTILVHWATNYFLFSWAYLVADLGDIGIVESFEHGLMATIEALVVIAGILAVAMTISRRMASKGTVPAEQSG